MYFLLVLVILCMELKMADKNLNPMNQKVYDVSERDNPANQNQQAIVKEQGEQLSPYKQMLGNMETRYGQSPEQMEDIMNRVSYHETGPGSRMDPTTTQVSGGPGRGLFQFDIGDAQGGMTAMRRLRQYFKDQGQDSYPKWTEFDPRQGVDASKLTPEQQKMMFMANTVYHPSSSFKGLNSDNLGDWWQNNHYAGPKDKRGIFNESMAAYNLKNTPTAEEKAFGSY